MPGASFESFEINSDTGEVVTTTMLDREVQEVFTLRGKGFLDYASKNKKIKNQFSGEMLHFGGVFLNKILFSQCYLISLA